LEILVHLALHNKVFGEQARMTLAGWDEKASIGVAADPSPAKRFSDTLSRRKNLRPALLPALLENPSVEQEALLELAATGARWVVEALLASETAKKSSALMTALETNPACAPVNWRRSRNRMSLPRSPRQPGNSRNCRNGSYGGFLRNSEIPTFPVVPDDSESVDHSVVEQAIAVISSKTRRNWLLPPTSRSSLSRYMKGQESKVERRRRIQAHQSS